MLNTLYTAAADPMLVFSGARERLARRYESDNAVVVIVVAIAIVLGLGFIAFLTAQCISRGYVGFGGVISVDEGFLNAEVTFRCIE